MVSSRWARVPGDREEHIVVAVVIAKAADFDEAEPVAVEPNGFVETFGVSGHAKFRGAWAGGCAAGASESRI
jgi:hypothetical protein